MAVPSHKGPFIKLGNIWVRYDLIGVITPKRGASLQPDEKEGEPYVMVVLTVPYKTIVVTDCHEDELLQAIYDASSVAETAVGLYPGYGDASGCLR